MGFIMSEDNYNLELKDIIDSIRRNLKNFIIISGSISFTALVQVFFGSHDPTTLNSQGPDHGPQYRSIAFFKNDKEKKIINDYIKALTEHDVYQGREITTQVVPFTIFYDAENYHQDYSK